MFDWSSVQQLLEEQRFDEVLERLGAVPEEERDTAEFLSIMGVLHVYSENWIDAAKFLLDALEKKPNDMDNLYNLCYVFVQMGDAASFRSCSNCLDRMELPNEIYQQLQEWKRQLYGTEHPRKVLMIAYYYPPLSGSGVFRTLKYTKYIRDYGWEPTVISAAMPPNSWNFRDDSQMDEIPEGMQVIRIHDEFSTGKMENKTINVGPYLEFQQSVFRHDPVLVGMRNSLMQQGHAGVLELMKFPAHDLIWAYKVADYIDKNIDMTEYDVIYTTSGPYSTHLLGCYLKEKYNIPWVADYRDEWTGNPYLSMDKNSVFYQMLLHLENLLLLRADKNITVARTLCDVYHQRFGVALDKIVSITNGYDERDFDDIQPAIEKNPCFTMTHTGIIHGKERSIEPLLAAVQQLICDKRIPDDKIRLQVVGAIAKDFKQLVRRYGLQKNVQIIKYCTHQESIRYAMSSDLLFMMMGDDEKYQHYYSGKIFEYVCTGKQILALATPHGVIAELFENMGYGLCALSTEQEKIQQYIYEEYQKWENSSEPVTYSYESRWRFERSYLTGCLADVLDSVTTQQTEAGANEFSSAVYDKMYKEGGAGAAYHKHYTKSHYYNSWKKAMKYLYLLPRDADILEVGCGVGQFANMLFDNGFHNYHGIDYAEEAIRLAKQNNPQRAALFTASNAFHDPLLEQQHDLVIMFEILEHIQDDLELLGRLPAGTRVLFSVPNFTDPTHVRTFADEATVRSRFSTVLDIVDVTASEINGPRYTLFYALGTVKGVPQGKQDNPSKSSKNMENLRGGVIESSIKLQKLTDLPSCRESALDVDRRFVELVDTVRRVTPTQLEEVMVRNFKKQSAEFRNFVAQVTQSYPIRGMVNANTGKGTMVTERIQSLKKHIDDFEWLYDRLADYRSRHVLYGILAHWITYKPALIRRIQENMFADYFDLDVMPLHDHEVVADLGMYIGDTAVAYHNTIGKHKMWYGYEVDARNVPKALANVANIPNVEVRQKAVSDQEGFLYMSAHSDSASNIVGKGDVRVPAVTLDNDIEEELTLIKMDIEGSEQAALRGSIRHIQNEKPKLAICTYHGNFDIWQIPRLIDSIRGDYKFYMRYNGRDLMIPREYVLIAI